MASCFPSQSCAVAFIEKLDGSALNLTQEEFEAYMQGRPLAPRGVRMNSEGWRRAQETRAQLEELQGRQERLHSGSQAMQQQLKQWVQSVQRQVDEVTSHSARAGKVTTPVAPVQPKVATSPTRSAKVDKSRTHPAQIQENEFKNQSDPGQVKDLQAQFVDQTGEITTQNPDNVASVYANY